MRHATTISVTYDPAAAPASLDVEAGPGALAEADADLTPSGRVAVPRRAQVVAFIRLGRPKFLISSLLSCGLGATLALREGGEFDLRWYALAQVFVWLVHLMTHYCNEYFDLSADMASKHATSWTGGSRVLVEGILSPSVSLGAAFVLLFAALALAAGMPSPAARSLALLALAFAWFYTAPPFQFNYRGLGEATVALVLNLLFPAIGGVLLTQAVPPLLPIVCAPIFLIQHARMMIMNLSDYDGDRRVGKRTLAVYLGPRRTVWVFVAEQGLAYALLAAWTASGLMPPAVGALLLATSPILVWQAHRLLRGGIRDPKSRNSIVFWASMHVSLTHCAALAGLALDALGRGLSWHATSLWFPTAVVGAFGLFFVSQLAPGRARS